jgi:hypothetical protein
LLQVAALAAWHVLIASTSGLADKHCYRTQTPAR